MSYDETISIPLADGEQVGGLLSLPERKTFVSLGLVLAHGRSTDMWGDDLEAVTQAAIGLGAAVLRFRFPFREAGRSKPDQLPRLQEAFRAATAQLRNRARLSSAQLVVGGRSLGARVASLMAAGGEAAGGLLLLAYPLHPAGDRRTLRDAHLYVVNRPMLFVSGSQDEFCSLELLRTVLRRLGELASLEVLEGADHGFRLAGETPAQRQALLGRLAARTTSWLNRHFPRDHR